MHAESEPKSSAREVPCRKLLLWDIDGTLFFGDRVGHHALIIALRRCFHIHGAVQEVDSAGRTEHHIARHILQANGIEPTDDAVHAFLEAYVDALEQELPARRTRLLPGVIAALEAVVACADLAQGLLTGNLLRCARLKLERFDTWRFFPFGAFGEDSVDRNELGPHALRRAIDHHQHPFVAARTFIIGDTPHDIACGKAIGAMTIAVATGQHRHAELAALDPTAVIDDLADTAAFMRLIDSLPAAAGRI